MKPKQYRPKRLYRYQGAVYNGEVVFKVVDMYTHAYTISQALLSIEARLHNEHKRSLYLRRHNMTILPLKEQLTLHYLYNIGSYELHKGNDGKYYTFLLGRWYKSDGYCNTDYEIDISKKVTIKSL